MDSRCGQPARVHSEEDAREDRLPIDFADDFTSPACTRHVDMLKDLPAAARPRERLLANGAVALADAELIALLLRTGLPGLSVLQMAQQMLDRFGGVAGLVRASVDDLKGIKGLGPAKRAEIAAVIELARRALTQQLAVRPAFERPADVKDYLALQLGERAFEVFAVLFLDAQQRLIKFEEMFRGTLTQTSVYPREIVKRALELHAASVVLAHNHPSGAAEPSRADEFLTQSLKSALALVDVRVLDHLVVGRGTVVSFAERGLL
jgi:DNA repair protein RadC